MVKKSKQSKSKSKSKVKKVKSFIPVQPNDYILLDSGTGKPKLAMVLGTTGNRAILEDGIEKDDSDNHIVFEPIQVIANLGSNPKVGKYLGVHVEPYRRTISNQEWGNIHIHRRMTKREKAAFFKSLVRVYKKLEKEASVSFLPLHELRVMAKHGKYAGSYTYRNKGDDRLDVIKIHPLTLEDPKYNDYLLYHECAHGIWYRCVPTSIQAKWVKLYTLRVALEDIKKGTLSSLFASVSSYEGTLRDYQKEVADDYERTLLKECCKYLKNKRHLGIPEYEMLIASDPDVAESVWPSHSEIDSLKMDVSEYAMKSAYEFFAESFAFTMMGTKMPKDVTKYMRLTLAKLRKY